MKHMLFDQQKSVPIHSIMVIWQNGERIANDKHTDPCIYGVIGYKKYIFDIWGDSVNVAARMETAGESGKINISEATDREVGVTVA